MKKLDSMTDLYVHELKDLHNAETQLIRALPNMAEHAASAELADAFTAHLEETREHASRLESILRAVGEMPAGETCEAMKGLIAEGDEAAKTNTDDDEIRDAAIIVAAQKVEHYEIAGYGSVCAFARRLGRTDDLKLLEETLAEEKEADKLLTELSESNAGAEN